MKPGLQNIRLINPKNQYIKLLLTLYFSLVILISCQSYVQPMTDRNAELPTMTDQKAETLIMTCQHPENYHNFSSAEDSIAFLDSLFNIVDTKHTAPPDTQFTVIVHAFVDKNGYIKKVKIPKSFENVEFDSLCGLLCFTWKLTPFLQNGKPVAVWVGIPIHFNLLPKKE